MTSTTSERTDLRDGLIQKAAKEGVREVLCSGAAVNIVSRKILRKYGREASDEERKEISKRIMEAPMLQARLLHEMGQQADDRVPPLYTPEIADSILDTYLEHRINPLPDDPTLPLSVRYSVPRWLVEHLSTYMSTESIESYLSLLNKPADVCLRINKHKKQTTQQVINELSKTGITATPDEVSKLGVVIKRCSGKANIKGSQVWRDGVVEVQDSGSQLLALAATPFTKKVKRKLPDSDSDTEADKADETATLSKPRILDFCAGFGGKTIQLASQHGSTHDVWAADISKSAMRELPGRVSRCQLTSVVSQKIHPIPESELFEVVMVDAPCSGLGRLRRRPDNRWRFDPKWLQSYCPTQSQVLDSASKHVLPGGVLVYATCTLNPAENHAITSSFQSSNPSFIPDPLVNAWGSTRCDHLGVPESENEMTLYPNIHGTDGFYVCRWRKVTNEENAT
eukprot:TRINITY_DN19976_c0_g1_i1.p1 TRINITY_DN19976_c0_g1~~TRINITY_DN19976_c0_g1_i1.p1  ORF type:complete len:454 (+),score=93.74 TRINITY_DN19976_c0_g1_i1:97-1458(+)